MNANRTIVSPEDEAAIRRALDSFVKASLDQDWDRFIATFDSEPICMPAGAPALTTHDAIRAFYTRFPALDALELVPESLEAAGALVVEVGRYQFTAGEFSDRGKYIHLWRRGDAGEWRLYRNIANSDGASSS
ncbi:MAG: nuclear transport factor 2 family protein [Gemmatimonadota bacterium]